MKTLQKVELGATTSLKTEKYLHGNFFNGSRISTGMQIYIILALYGLPINVKEVLNKSHVEYLYRAQ